MPWGQILVHRFPVLGPQGIVRVADAEQAKSTGGMLALYPRVDDAMKMAVPDGEPPEELHVTLVYLGEDISGVNAAPLAHLAAGLADQYAVITARIMGHGVFNPDGGENGDKEPCAVYLVSDSEQLPDLHADALAALDGQVDFPLPVQHKPFVPHITAGYSMSPGELHYTGPVLFDRIGLAVGGTTHYFPLQGATTSPYSS